MLCKPSWLGCTAPVFKLLGCHFDPSSGEIFLYNEKQLFDSKTVFFFLSHVSKTFLKVRTVTTWYLCYIFSITKDSLSSDASVHCKDTDFKRQHNYLCNIILDCNPNHNWCKKKIQRERKGAVMYQQQNKVKATLF